MNSNSWRLRKWLSVELRLHGETFFIVTLYHFLMIHQNNHQAFKLPTQRQMTRRYKFRQAGFEVLVLVVRWKGLLNGVTLESMQLDLFWIFSLWWPILIKGKPVWMSLFCWTQRKIFWRKFVTRLFWGTIDFHSREKNTMEVNGTPELLCLPHSSE